MSGILSQIAGFANRFSEELINPTNGLGKLGMYLGAASGSPLGQAQYAAHQDALKAGDTALERQYKLAQIAHLNAPSSNDTNNDYNLYLQHFGKEYADEWLKNQGEKPQAVQSVDPATGQVTTYFVRPSMIGGIPGMAPPPAPKVAPPQVAPPNITFTPLDDGGPAPKTSGPFR